MGTGGMSSEKQAGDQAGAGAEGQSDEGGDVELGGGVSPSESEGESDVEAPSPPQRKRSSRHKYPKFPRSTIISSYTDEGEDGGRECCCLPRLPPHCSPCRELRDCIIAMVVLYWAVLQLSRKHGWTLWWSESLDSLEVN